MYFDSCQQVSSLPHQASVEDQFPGYRDILPKGKPLHPGAILQDQVGRLGLGVQRAQAHVGQNLSPKNNALEKTRGETLRYRRVVDGDLRCGGRAASLGALDAETAGHRELCREC